MTRPTSSGTEISRTDAKKALLRSGYLLESRAETVLRDFGYYVETNAAYPDPHNSTSRELDLLALTSPDDPGDELVVHVDAFLLIECVNNPPLVLLSKTPQHPSHGVERVHVSGLPIKFPTQDDSWERLVDFLNFEGFHHYCTDSLATQYCSFRQKKTSSREWMATHDDDHFDAFRKLCDAIDFHCSDHNSALSREQVAEWIPVGLRIYYPILLIQGSLEEGRATKRSVNLRQRSHLQLLRSHQWR